MRSAHPVYQEAPIGPSSPAARPRGFSTGSLPGGFAPVDVRQSRVMIVPSRLSRISLRSTAVLMILLCGLTTAPAARAGGAAPPPQDAGATPRAPQWHWPVRPFRLDRPFVAPPHRYGPGHRGIDVRALGEPAVVAPDGGIVAFSGDVAGRGILTIDHGGGLVSTLEPIASDLIAGTAVARGAPVGVISTGGHADAGALHLGARLDGEYINPLVLLGGVPRAVLLPCC